MAQAKMDFIINTKVDKTAFSELKREIQSLQALSEQDLVKMGAAPDLSSAKTQLTQIQNSAKQVETALNKAFSPKLGTVSLSKFNDELKSMDLQKIANDFQKAGAAGQTAFRDLAANVLTTKVQLKEISPLLKEFGQTMKNTIKWGISSSALNTFTGSLQKAYSYAKNLDTSLNNIRIVAGQSADEMDRFAVKANKAAKELGKTTLDYTNAALIYYQQGTLNDAEIAERTAATLKMANVTGEAAQDVSDYMTAIWNNFYDGSKSIEYYADVMTALGAATASSTDEIAAGLEKFAAIADTVGLSYEYATAALATVTAETRQSADVVGTAFKTMFARIQDLELGETLEDGVTLGSYSEALNKIGVSVLDINGNMRDMNSILNDMGARWGDLTQAQKVATAEAVAGTRQYTQLVALMDNWDVFQANINTAANATGTLNEQQEIYMESTRAHLNQLSAAAERLYDNLIDSDGLNSLIDIFSGLVTGVSEYTEAIGGSGAAFSQLGALAMKAFGKDISQEVARTVSNIKMMKEGTEQVNAQLKMLQQFKGIEINDASFYKLVDMTEQLESYKNILTEVQYQEAQAMIQSRNEVANDLDIWEERRQQAEAYFKIFTDNTINLDQNPSLINVENLTNELDNVLGDYQSKIGDIVKSFKTEFEKGNADIVESYIDNAKNMIRTNLIQNEDLLKSLQKALADYEKITANTKIENVDELTEDQRAKLDTFVKAYGKAADSMVKDANKVKETVKEAARGSGEALKAQLNQVDDAWRRMMDRFNVQAITQHFTDLSSQVMMIASSIQSIGRIPNIWNDENLSTGEKLLQTIIAVANAANGIAQTFKLVHTTAQLLTATVFGNTAAFEASAVAQRDSNKALEENKEQVIDNALVQDFLQDEMGESEKSHKDSQTYLQKTSKAVVANSKVTDDNTRSVRQNTAARVENNGALEMNPDLMKMATEDVQSFANEDALKEADKIADKVKGYNDISKIRSNSEYQKKYKNLLRGQKSSHTKALKRAELDSALYGGQSTIDATKLKAVTDEDLIKAAQRKADEWWASQHPEDTKTILDEIGFGGKGDIAGADDVLEKTDKLAETAKNLKKEFKPDPDQKGGLIKTLFGNAKQDLSVIGKAIGMIPPQAWIAVAAIAAVGAAIYAIHRKVTEEERELQEALERTQEKVTETQKALDDANSAFDNYKTAQDALKGLEEGTVEFYNELINANEKALELIDTLGLLAGDYSIDEKGVIRIDEDAIENALQEKQKDVFQAQGTQAYAKYNMAEYERRNIVSDFQNEVNRESRFGVGMNRKTAEDILSGNLKETKVGDEYHSFENLSAINDINTAFDDTADKISKTGAIVSGIVAPLSTLSWSVGTEIFDQGVIKDGVTDITDEVGAFKAEYGQKTAEMIALEKQMADAFIRAYADEESLEIYSGANAKQQELMGKYTTQQREKVAAANQLQTTNKGGWNSFWDTSDNGFWGQLGIGILDGLMSGLTFGAHDIQQGYSQATSISDMELKELYAENVLGYTQDDDGQWRDVQGKRVKDKEIRKIDLDDATDAYNSGQYSTALSSEYITKLYSDTRQNAAKEGFSGDSQDYISEAVLAFKTGDTDYDFSALTDEEKEQARKEIQKIYAEQGNQMQEGQLPTMINFNSQQYDETKRLAEDTKRFDEALQSEAESVGASEDALRLYALAQEKAGKTNAKLTATTAKTAAANYKFNKTYNEGREAFADGEDAWKTYIQALKDGENISYDVADAAGEIVTSLRDMGINLSNEQLANPETLENIKTLFSGTEEEAAKAYETLRDISWLEDLTKNFGIAEDAAKSFINTLKDTQNGTPITLSDEILKGFGDTEKTLEEWKAWAESYGIDVEVATPETKITEADLTHPERTSKHVIHAHTDAEGNEVPEYSYTETEYVAPEKVYGIGDLKLTKISSGGGNFKASASTSSGSKSKPRKEDRLEEQKDRYHDINIELKQIANELQKVQDEQDNLVGSDLIANLQRQYNLLNKEIDATARKIGIAKGEQDELQAKLAGSGVNFNEDGTIANYAAAWDAQLAYVNGIIDKYNAMSADEQEKYQDTLDNAKEQWEKFKENVERYDTLITEDIPGLEADIRAALDQQIEIKLEAFEYEIQIRLDMSEAERDWNEFKKKIIDGIKEDDILGNAKARLKDFDSYYKADGTGEIQASTKHVNNILDQLKQMDADQAAGAYGETYTYTNASGEEVTVDYNNRKQALEDLKEYYSQIMSSMMDLQELEEEIHQSYLDMMDEAQEKFDEQLETYQTIDEIIQHDMNLVKLMYGDSAGLAEYYKEQRKNLDNQLDFQKQQVAFWKNQMDTLEEGSDAWESAKEKWMATGAEWRSLAEQNLQVITDQYLDSITTIFETLNNNVTNGMGLDYVSKEWDLINQNADRYLDQVNAIYETQSLQNKYLDAIENATNPTQQKKLNELMEDEIALLQEKDKLSQYDIDRANLKYEIAMKQMALEESQQKKTQLRLRRDSQGNYTYQYTNDDSEVSKLKDELSDLYNQLYNLDAGQYKSNLDELYSVWESFQADMFEAAQINDPEKRKEREELLEREYGELINGIVADNEFIKQNLQQSTASQLFDLYDQNAENYEQMTEAQKSILDNFISAETDYNNMAFDNLFGLYNENLVAFDTMTQEQIDTLMNDFIPQWNSGVQQMVDTIIGEGGFTQVTKAAIEEIRALAATWDAERKAAYEEAKTMAEEMQTATEELAKDNTELISTYQTQLEEVQKVIDKLGEMKLAYEQAAAAAKTAAEEAYKYWQAASNKAASTDTTIDTTDYKKPEEDTKEVQKKDSSSTSSAPSLSVGSTVSVKPGTKWYADSYGGGSWGYATGGKIAYVSNGPYGYNIGGSGWIKKTDIVGYDTGGYTGEWNSTNGKLAMLHQKELVLNANDTKNILNAVEILRNITSNLGQALMNQMASISANNTSAIANTIGSDTLEQTVHIDAQFPNVRNSNEIETAINNLVNMASQHIQKN